jgi:hypothetical protein
MTAGDAIFLVFTACIGNQCHEVGLATFPSVEACARESIPAVSEWMGRHPAFTSYKTITCGPEPADEGDDL